MFVVIFRQKKKSPPEILDYFHIRGISKKKTQVLKTDLNVLSSHAM